MSMHMSADAFVFLLHIVLRVHTSVCVGYVRICEGASERECRGWRAPRREDCVSLRSLIPCGALSSGGLLLSFLAKI